MAEQDRQQSGEDDRNGHRFGPHPEQRAVADGGVGVVAAGHRRLQVDQHDHAELGRHAGQRDQPDPGRHRLVIAEQVKQPHPAGQRERQRRHDQRGLGEAAERQVEQHEDDQKRRGHDELQPLDGAFEIFELAGVGDADAGACPHAPRHCLLQVVDHGGKVAPAHIDIDPGRRPPVFAAKLGRSFGHTDLRQAAERHLLQRRGQHRQPTQFLDAVAKLARVAQVDRIARKSLDGLANGLAAAQLLLVT